jgi:hypothetical protein
MENESDKENKLGENQSPGVQAWLEGSLMNPSGQW